MDESKIEPAIYRILDCNLNRASEAIRVVEDCLRFSLNDKRLSESAKNLRHDLHQAFRAAEQTDPNLHHRMITMRDSNNDVGRTIANPSEARRSGIKDILYANLKRFEQASRSLEEASKTVDARLASSIEKLRYESYSLEKQIFATLSSRSRLLGDWLCVLIDGSKTIAQFESRVVRLIAASVSIIQLRDKRLSDKELLERGAKLQALTKGSSTKWIFNDRADLAVSCDADGVHLGQGDLPLAAARQIVGPDRMIGVSTHSMKQVDQAIVDGADYIGVGPVFQSQTKQFDNFIGLELLSQVSRETCLPAFAIGGISLENAQQVFGSGFQRIAVSGMFSDPCRIDETASRLLRLRDSALARHTVAAEKS